jgi:hypothetical protein
MDNPLVASFSYDLVNLDFLGGMGYRDKNGEAKRVRAIKKIIERQSRTNFLLMLTLNVRDGLEDEFDRYLQSASRIEAFQELQEVLEWYRVECGKGMKEYKLKSVVPLFIQRQAEQFGFDCYSHPAIVYEGDGRAKMVHFVFELKHTSIIFPAYSDQRSTDVLNLVFLGVRNDGLYILETQHPKFNYLSCENQLSFLPENIKEKVLSTLP